MPSFTNEKVNDINLGIKASEVSTSGGYVQQNSVYVDDIVKNDPSSAVIVDFGELTTPNNQELVDSLYDEIGKRSWDFDDSPVKFTDNKWCADFVSYMLWKNGYNYEWGSWAGRESVEGSIFTALRKGGAEIHYGEYAAASGHTPDLDYVPQPGDVFLLNTEENPPGDVYPDHVGIVVKDNGDGTVTTIEGNTSNENGEIVDGGIVAIKIRPKSEIYGYATPKKP